MKFNPAWATIIVRMSEILSEILWQRFFENYLYKTSTVDPRYSRTWYIWSIGMLENRRNRKFHKY